MSETTYKLISHHFCPYVQRARIVMLEKQIPHTLEYIDLNAPPSWFHEISPLEKVPVLLVGDQALFESMPICEYLDEVSPGSLYAEDPLLRARQRAWAVFGNELLDQQFTLTRATDERTLKQARAQLEDSLDLLEEVLEAGPFFAGSKFTMVDAVCAPIFRNFDVLERECGENYLPAEMQRVCAWARALLQRPSVKQAVGAEFTTYYSAFLRRNGGLIGRTMLETVEYNQ